ncbi:MAG: TlpA family protein disulfide reductase [Pseudarcicella sp.]|nr:TlpA family protein disulfide reductase [Pseudarcicella sp.]
MKSIIKWNILGFLAFLLFVPILKLDQTMFIYTWAFAIYFIIGLIVFKAKDSSKYFILLPLNLILSIIAIFLNPALFPLIFPFVNLYSILGFFIGGLLRSSKTKLKLGIISIAIVLFALTGIKFIPEQAFEKRLISTNDTLLVKNIELLDLNGDPLDSIAFKGKVSILNFTFIGCSQCVLKNPYLEKIRENYAADDKIKIIDVYIGSKNSIVEIKKYLLKHPTKLDVAYDTNDKMAQLFKYNGAPHEVIIAQNRQVKRTIAGFNRDIKNIYISKSTQLIDDLLVSN